MPTETASNNLRIKTVLQRTGLSRSTMYRKMQNGTFPRKIQVSQRCAGRCESAIEGWLRAASHVDYLVGGGAVIFAESNWSIAAKVDSIWRWPERRLVAGLANKPRWLVFFAQGASKGQDRDRHDDQA